MASNQKCLILTFNHSGWKILTHNQRWKNLTWRCWGKQRSWCRSWCSWLTKCCQRRRAFMYSLCLYSSRSHLIFKIRPSATLRRARSDLLIPWVEQQRELFPRGKLDSNDDNTQHFQLYLTFSLFIKDHMMDGVKGILTESNFASVLRWTKSTSDHYWMTLRYRANLTLSDSYLMAFTMAYILRFFHL